MLQNWVIKRITNYQNKGGSQSHFNLDCNFTPTCSEYTKQAILRFGLIKGGWMGLQRIHSCNDADCSNIIHDPVPLKLPKQD